MTAAQRTPYIIKSDPIPERYARGWHVLGKASDFTAQPQKLEYFGAKLVAYRGRDDGQVHVLDAYCPHMGGDLSLGEVKGDSVVCPFHEWSWGADGVCDDIPYAKHIPDKACIKSWPTTEQNGLLFVWNDPEGNAPIAEQYPQRMEDYYSGEWTDWKMTRIPIESNCRELVDNMADLAHFGPVHFTRNVYEFRNVQDGHTFVQHMSGGHDLLTEGDIPMTSVAIYEGPAYMTTTMTGAMDGTPMIVHLLVSHVPVHTELFHINFGVMVKKVEGKSEAESKAMLDQYFDTNIAAFQQDVDVWNNKVRVDNPLMCDGDGPINMVRKWYSQFYIDVADIPARLVARKEHVTIEKH
jgi:3-ketosteroid 9alpha-monooxygenase subunit A